MFFRLLWSESGLKLQQKLEERARKKEVPSLKKSSSVADSNSATKGESLLTSVVNVVPNPGDSGSLELNSDK